MFLFNRSEKEQWLAKLKTESLQIKKYEVFENAE